MGCEVQIPHEWFTSSFCDHRLLENLNRCLDYKHLITTFNLSVDPEFGTPRPGISQITPERSAQCAVVDARGLDYMEIFAKFCSVRYLL